jgi:hypothetical protein
MSKKKAKFEPDRVTIGGARAQEVFGPMLKLALAKQPAGKNSRSVMKFTLPPVRPGDLDGRTSARE